MKTLWKYILYLGAIIGGIIALTAGRGSKKQFKKDIKDNKKKIDAVKDKQKDLDKKEKVIKDKIAKKDKDIKVNKGKIKSTKSVKKTISNFEKKYRSKKIVYI